MDVVVNMSYQVERNKKSEVHWTNQRFNYVTIAIIWNGDSSD